MVRRAALYNLGCKVNAYETDAMTELLIDAGYRIVDFDDDAEVYIINTCTVTNTADKKSRQILHRARKSHPESVILATGCYVETWEDPDNTVDILVGNNCKKDIVEILDAWFREHEEQGETHEFESVSLKSNVENNSTAPVKDVDSSTLFHVSDAHNRVTASACETGNCSVLFANVEGNLDTAHNRFSGYRRFADINHVRNYEDLKITETSGHTRAFIKVQDGCNQFCSYCMIPYARGRVRSRAMEDVLSEVRDLVLNGYHEVVLTGIHLSSYGTDFDDPTISESDVGVTRDYKSSQTDSVVCSDVVTDESGMENKYITTQADDTTSPESNLEITGLTGNNRAGSKQRFYLTQLIRKVHEIEGLDRIRLGSLEPRIVTDEFIGEMSTLPKLCHHFHLSLQSGCDRTLKAMNRRYSSDEYMASCLRIRNAWPDAAITTDVITGFPGETEEDFEESYNFVKNVNFYETHIFPYSRRRGTRADAMTGHLPESVKKARSARLIELNRINKRNFMESFVGLEVAILPEETAEISGMPGKYILGHTMEYVHCAVPEEEVAKWLQKCTINNVRNNSDIDNVPDEGVELIKRESNDKLLQLREIKAFPEKFIFDEHSREELMLCHIR